MSEADIKKQLNEKENLSHIEKNITEDSVKEYFKIKQKP